MDASARIFRRTDGEEAAEVRVEWQVTRTAFHPGAQGLCPTRTQTEPRLERSLMKIPTFL